jgi:probable rRNA maturation factor
LSEFHIDIAIKDPRWSSALPQNQNIVQKAVEAGMTTMAREQLDIQLFDELSVAFVSDNEIQSLNKQFRSKDKPTNVLSFPGLVMDGKCPMLGDIVLGYETVTREAKERALSLKEHVMHLIVHGLYHLQGFDHENDVDATEMEALEIRTLEVLGISNPYVKDETL